MPSMGGEREGKGWEFVAILFHARHSVSHLTCNIYSVLNVCYASNTLCEFSYLILTVEPYCSLLGILQNDGHPHNHFITVDTVGKHYTDEFGALRIINSVEFPQRKWQKQNNLSWSFWLHGPCLFLSIKQIHFKCLKIRHVETRNEGARAYHQYAMEEEKKGWVADDTAHSSYVSQGGLYWRFWQDKSSCGNVLWIAGHFVSLVLAYHMPVKPFPFVPPPK